MADTVALRESRIGTAFGISTIISQFQEGVFRPPLTNLTKRAKPLRQGSCPGIIAKNPLAFGHCSRQFAGV